MPSLADESGGRPHADRLSAALDLLEYQGKELFARHGVPVPTGKVAHDVKAAVEAAEEIGYPCVVKAQVLIGGRGKAGGIKVANDRDEAEQAAEAIIGMDITGPHGEGPFTVHQVWVEGASEIESEYYFSFILDRSAKKVLAMLSTMGGMDVEAIAETDPDALAKVHVDPSKGFGASEAKAAGRQGRRPRGVPAGDSGTDLQALRRLRRRGRDARRGQSPDRHQVRRRDGARREGHDRQLGPVPARGAGRAAGRLDLATRRSRWPRRRT